MKAFTKHVRVLYTGASQIEDRTPNILLQIQKVNSKTVLIQIGMSTTNRIMISMPEGVTCIWLLSTLANQGLFMGKPETANWYLRFTSKQLFV